MKDIISHLNKDFENRIRLGVMSILVVNEWVEFKRLKELLALTDGNLASHISALEKKEYLLVRKAFVGKKPQTTYKASDLGKKAFAAHLDALEKLIRNLD